MFETGTLLAFFVASVTIIITPGPAQALVLARTVSAGWAAGILTAVGLNVGTLVHALAAGLGVSSILVTSATAFATVKYLGAAYLIYLGIVALRSRNVDRAAQSGGSSQAIGRAVVTGVLNPKVALFFLAFLPQFVDPQRGSVLVQCLILGALLALMDIVYESGLVLIGSAATESLASPRFERWRNRITGTVLVGLGAKLALADSK